MNFSEIPTTFVPAESENTTLKTEAPAERELNQDEQATLMNVMDGAEFLERFQSKIKSGEYTKVQLQAINNACASIRENIYDNGL